MNLWGESPLSEDSTLTMLLTSITTSRRQGRYCEVWSEGSRSAKRRADEQKSDTRPSRRVEWAHDHEDHEFARHGKSGGCVVTVHALIWGDLFTARCGARGAGLRASAKALGHPPDPKVTHSTTCGNARREWTEVSSGHSSGEGRSALHAKDQRNRTGQRLAVLDHHVACVTREVRIGV
jgi:hypothetical protein